MKLAPFDKNDWYNWGQISSQRDIIKRMTRAAIASHYRYSQDPENEIYPPGCQGFGASASCIPGVMQTYHRHDNHLVTSAIESGYCPKWIPVHPVLIGGFPGGWTAEMEEELVALFSNPGDTWGDTKFRTDALAQYKIGLPLDDWDAVANRIALPNNLGTWYWGMNSIAPVLKPGVLVGVPGILSTALPGIEPGGIYEVVECTLDPITQSVLARITSRDEAFVVDTRLLFWFPLDGKLKVWVDLWESSLGKPDLISAEPSFFHQFQQELF